MADFVLDASVAMAWCFGDEATSYTERVLQAASVNGTEAIAPTLWSYEIRNCVLMGLRRKRIAKNDAEDFLLSLRDLHLRFVEPPAPDEILTLADDHGLTFYDASYLDLALRAHLPLASLDRDLVRAAERAGLRLFQP